MTFPNEQLFLDRFVAYNKARYKDTRPSFLSVLDSLTLDQIEFSNYRKDLTQSVPVYIVDMYSKGLFLARNQSYTPGDYVFNHVSVLVDETPLDLPTLTARTTPGIYKLQTAPNTLIGALLVAQGTKTADNVRQLVKANCLYDLLDTEIIVDDTVTLVTIDSQTIIGTLRIVESVPVATFDGTFVYDGTLTY